MKLSVTEEMGISDIEFYGKRIKDVENMKKNIYASMQIVVSSAAIFMKLSVTE